VERPATAHALQRSAALLARFGLSLIFLLSGIGKFAQWDATIGYMEAEGMSAAPFWLALAAIVEIVGGLSVLTGTLTRIGAAALVLFLIPATLIFHDFWSYAGAERQGQMIHLLKNVAIMGGLLQLVTFGPGTWSVDRKLEQRLV
jgi:putative oxidoreductase